VNAATTRWRFPDLSRSANLRGRHFSGIVRDGSPINWQADFHPKTFEVHLCFATKWLTTCDAQELQCPHKTDEVHAADVTLV
jgi:hypothetical protein